MPNSKKTILILLCIVIVVFIIGIGRLFVNLSNQGLLYPVFSSLNTEPQGLRALFESYEETGAVSVERAFVSFDKLEDSHTATHIVAGISPYLLSIFPQSLVTALDSSLMSGANLVIAFNPAGGFFYRSNPFLSSRDSTDTLKQDKETKKDSLDTSIAKDSLDSYFLPKPVSLYKKWGFALKRELLGKDSSGNPLKFSWVYSTKPVLEDSLKWISTTLLNTTSDGWDTLYTRNEMPVVLSRAFGKGRIILAADSYFLTNEALAYDRTPALLSHIIGTNQRIVFHEAHLGLVKRSGLLSIIMKYRLHGFFISIAILMLLYVWKNAFPLVSVAYEIPVDSKEEHLLGNTGLKNMIKSSLKKNSLIDTCVTEWERSSSLPKEKKNQIGKKIESAYADLYTNQAHTQNPMGFYNHICDIISENKSSLAHKKTVENRLTSKEN